MVESILKGKYGIVTKHNVIVTRGQSHEHIINNLKGNTNTQITLIPANVTFVEDNTTTYF